jgi:hypothetical protein
MTIPADVRIKKATYAGDYTIRFTFTDRRVSEIDFHPFLSAAGQNPMNSLYLDVLRFWQFKRPQRGCVLGRLGNVLPL